MEKNQKKMYEHFVKTEQFERAKEILKVYPQFEAITEKAKENKKKK